MAVIYQFSCLHSVAGRFKAEVQFPFKKRLVEAGAFGDLLLHSDMVEGGLS